MELCDLLLALGPDAPTLAGSWTTGDLAAHLVVRERDPRAIPGIVLRRGRAAARTARLQEAERGRGHAAVVARLRAGPPWWGRLPGLEATAGLNEFFIHHEDVRRANGTGRRTDRPDLEDGLWRLLRRLAPFLRLRLRGVGIELRRPEGDAIIVRKHDRTAVLSGHPSELVLYLGGRRAAADVALDGDPAAVDAVSRADLSI
jgi:uncharacterized protein (TIGR03085 family)